MRDQRVNDLLDKIAANYRLILDSKPLERIQSCKTTIERMLDTTKEWALFYVEYCKTQNFGNSGFISEMNAYIND